MMLFYINIHYLCVCVCTYIYSMCVANVVGYFTPFDLLEKTLILGKIDGKRRRG